MSSFNQFLNDPNRSYINPSSLTDEIKVQTGKTLIELMAEAISIERQNMMNSGNSQAYISLLVPIFNKFAIGAPLKAEISNPLENMTKEDLENYRNNLMTRLALERSTQSQSIID